MLWRFPYTTRFTTTSGRFPNTTGFTITYGDSPTLQRIGHHAGETTAFTTTLVRFPYTIQDSTSHQGDSPTLKRIGHHTGEIPLHFRIHHHIGEIPLLCGMTTNTNLFAYMYMHLNKVAVSKGTAQF